MIARIADRLGEFTLGLLKRALGLGQFGVLVLVAFAELRDDDFLGREVGGEFGDQWLARDERQIGEVFTLGAALADLIEAQLSVGEEDGGRVDLRVEALERIIDDVLTLIERDLVVLLLIVLKLTLKLIDFLALIIGRVFQIVERAGGVVGAEAGVVREVRAQPRLAHSRDDPLLTATVTWDDGFHNLALVRLCELAA